MVLPIYLYGQKVLRKRATEIAKVTPELAKLADDMLETMYHSNGIGLAAPQVGKSIRLVVVDVAGEEEEKKPDEQFDRLYRLDSRGSLEIAEGHLGSWSGDSAGA